MINPIFNKIQDKFIQIKNSLGNPAYPYDCLHEAPYQAINATEKVKFSDNFTNWALSLLSDDFVLIGDIEDMLFSFCNRKK